MSGLEDGTNSLECVDETGLQSSEKIFRIQRSRLIWIGFGHISLELDQSEWPKILSNLVNLTEGTIIDRRQSPKRTLFYGYVGPNSFCVLRPREGTFLFAKWRPGEVPRRVFCLLTSLIATSYFSLGVVLPGLLSMTAWSTAAFIGTFVLAWYAGCVYSNRFVVGRLPRTLSALLVPGTEVKDLPRRGFWSFY